VYTGFHLYPAVCEAARLYAVYPIAGSRKGRQAFAIDAVRRIGTQVSNCVCPPPVLPCRALLAGLKYVFIS
jgi:hypothetical protein